MTGSALVAQPSAEGIGRNGGAGSARSPIVGALLLVLTVTSVSSAVALALTDVGPFVASNQSTLLERRLAAQVLVIALFGSAIPLGLAAWFGGARLKSALVTWGFRLAPPSLPYFVPAFRASH